MGVEGVCDAPLFRAQLVDVRWQLAAALPLLVRATAAVAALHSTYRCYYAAYLEARSSEIETSTLEVW